MQIGHMARWGIALIAMPGVLDGAAVVAQSLPAGGHAAPTPGPPRLARTPAQPPDGRGERSARDDRRPEPTYFQRGSLQLALGAATFWERPAAQPEAATFLSAGLHLSPSLAVVGEMGRGWWASGRRETPSPSVSPGGCPDIQAGFHTFMGGVQYRLARIRRSTKFVQVLAGRASFAGTAKKLDSWPSSSCLDAFSSGFALAAGGGADVHLTDRLALRIAADYRRLAIPALEGTERVFMRDDADRHLGMVRVAVGFVLGI